MIKKAIALGTAGAALVVAGMLVLAYPATAHYADCGPNCATQRADMSAQRSSVSAGTPPASTLSCDPTATSRAASSTASTYTPTTTTRTAEGVSRPLGADVDWFLSADGHLSTPEQKHSGHQGDMPSPLVMADGTARLSFTTDRIDPETLRGRAVILHHLPDNFGNVPLGDGHDLPEYTPNASSAAIDLTNRTGNAGDRVACGLIRRSR